jgi:hypothetical protein
MLDLRELRSESELVQTLPDFAAALFRASLGDEAFDALVRCESEDRLDQAVVLTRLGGLIAGRGLDQPHRRVWRKDASAIVDDLRSLRHRQAKVGTPPWLSPRGKERSNLLEVEHRRRAVVWQRFIATARGAEKPGSDEVSKAFGISIRSLSDWVGRICDDPDMKERLDAAVGQFVEATGQRIAAIQDGRAMKIVWMMPNHTAFGRGQPGHYQELLTSQANEYRAMKRKVPIS